MIKIENTEVVGWEHAIRGMRNPMNSWDNSDTIHGTLYKLYDGSEITTKDGFSLGENDLSLMQKLAKAGSAHAKYKRMINVYCDITAPIYWWKEWDTYLHTVRNSCSTMHKIHSKPIELSDFSIDNFNIDDDTCEIDLEDCFINVVADCEMLRKKYIETNDKRYWKGLIQLLPSSYNQKATVMMNYEVLSAMYKWRRNHKLDEWQTFCDWIEKMPYSELITGGIDNE